MYIAFIHTGIDIAFVKTYPLNMVRVNVQKAIKMFKQLLNADDRIKLDGQGRARLEAARRRKSEWKVNLGNGNSSRSNDS